MAKILVAEDDQSLLHFLVHALTRAGHIVASAEDGTQALQHLEREQFDVLVTDISMPEVDGVTLANQASKRWPTLRIVFITGFSAMITKCQQEYSHQIKLLSKPFHLKDLIHQIDLALAEM